MKKESNVQKTMLEAQGATMFATTQAAIKTDDGRFIRYGNTRLVVDQIDRNFHPVVITPQRKWLVLLLGCLLQSKLKNKTGRVQKNQLEFIFILSKGKAGIASKQL